AGIQDHHADVVLDGSEEAYQSLSADRLGTPVLVQQDDFFGLATVAAEVNDLGLVLIEKLQKVDGAYRPLRQQFQLVAVRGGPDDGLDLSSFFVQGQRGGADRVGGQQQDLDLAGRGHCHVAPICRQSTLREFVFGRKLLQNSLGRKCT